MLVIKIKNGVPKINVAFGSVPAIICTALLVVLKVYGPIPDVNWAIVFLPMYLLPALFLSLALCAVLGVTFIFGAIAIVSFWSYMWGFFLGRRHA